MNHILDTFSRLIYQETVCSHCGDTFQIFEGHASGEHDVKVCCWDCAVEWSKQRAQEEAPTIGF